MNHCNYPGKGDHVLLIVVMLIATFTAKTSLALEMKLDITLQRLVREALLNNTALQSKEKQVEALHTEIPVAGSLENPRITLGLANLPVDTFDLDQEPMTQKQIFIAQKIPWFGKLELKEQSAALEAARIEALFRAEQLALIKKLSQTWYDLNFIEESLDTNTRLQEMISQLLRVAETRYATGKGLQQDILAGQVELSSLLNERITLESRKRRMSAKLGEFLSTEQIYIHDSGGFRPPVLSKKLDTELLIQRSLLKNPRLQAEKISLNKAKLAVRLAEKDFGPDMDFRLGYGQREDDGDQGRADFFSALVTFSIPLWQSSRQGPQLTATQQRLIAAEKSVQSFHINIPHKIEAIAAEIQSSVDNAKLLKDALTLQADQFAESSLTAYSVGEVDFNTMLKARINTLRYELLSQKYQYEALKNIAELNEFIGEPKELLHTSASSMEQLPTENIQ